MAGQIYSIVYQTELSRLEEPYRFNRIRTEHATLVANHGIQGDRKAGKSPKRQLNIMSLETLEQLNAEGYKTEPGAMGEQIIVQGMDLAKFERGTQLRFGENAVIEITMPRSGCVWFEKIQGKSHDVDLGILARVLEGGEIHVGASVEVVNTQESIVIS